MRSAHTRMPAVLLTLGALVASAALVAPAAATTSTTSAAAPQVRPGTSVSASRAPGLIDPDGNPVVVDDPGSGSHATRPGAAGTLMRPTVSGSVLDTLAKSAPKAKKKLRTLVVPVHWSGVGKDSMSRKKLTKAMKRVDTWYRHVSKGRVGHATTVLGWQKIARPGARCDLPSNAWKIASSAEARARKAGKKPQRFDRVIIYVSSKDCRGATTLGGLGSLPGRYVWLNGTIELNVLVHELGHNLGLFHADYLRCGSTRRSTLAKKVRSGCKVTTYDDATDVMGAYSTAGWFSTPKLTQLGWLTKTQRTTMTAKKKKGTYTLVPVSSPKRGLKSVRVTATKTRTYWVEHRASTGLDSSLEPGLHGVQVRMTDVKASPAHGPRAGSLVLDMHPENLTMNYGDASTVSLPQGSSWTSPEGIRFTAQRSTGAAAKVVIARKKKATKPSRPSSLTAKNVDGALALSWTRAKDNGAPVNRYTIRLTAPGRGAVTATVPSHGGRTTTHLVEDLPNDVTWTASVTATTEKGTSTTRTTTARTGALMPSVRITSPAAGTTIKGTHDVTVVPVQNPASKSPVYYVAVCLDGGGCAQRFAPEGLPSGVPVTLRLTVPTWVRAGEAQIRATVYDWKQREAFATLPVVVAHAP